MEFRYDKDPNVKVTSFKDLKNYIGMKGILKLKKYSFGVKGTLEIKNDVMVSFRYDSGQKTQGLLYTFSRESFDPSYSSMFESLEVIVERQEITNE